MFVARRDGTITSDRSVEASAEAVVRAFVFWAERPSGADTLMLGMEIFALPDGETFEQFFQDNAAASLRENLQRPGRLMEPLVSRSETWIDGRRCLFVDHDGFYDSRGYFTRRYYVQANRHAIVFLFGFTNPSERAGLNDSFADMIALGAPLSAGGPGERTAIDEVHRTVCQALAAAAGQAATLTLRKNLREREEIRSLAVAYCCRALTRPTGGFLDRGRNVVTAQASYDQRQQPGRPQGSQRVLAQCQRNCGCGRGLSGGKRHSAIDPQFGDGNPP